MKMPLYNSIVCTLNINIHFYKSKHVKIKIQSKNNHFEIQSCKSPSMQSTHFSKCEIVLQ